MTLASIAGTSWAGQGELWLDQLHNEVELCDCTIEVSADELRYAWSYQGAPHQGRVTVTADGATFTDTWHAPDGFTCVPIPDAWGLLGVRCTFAAGDGPPWGWEITVALRPGGDELVLQMTNVAPWGEHGRAVRMIVRRR
jgi:hypothetical protein